ncbi:MAG: hypothetical protein DRO63_08320 [Candidatus Gerdarchaeota archaeon]|nr:MAG: hypothetical protein DRO63_08320 [Candidatus Gerdarchaeota archaeon]
MTIGFVIDSASDIPWEYAKELGVQVVSLNITFDDRTFKEDEQFDLEAYYARFVSDRKFIPKTAQPSPQQFVKAYEALIAEGKNAIVVVTISSQLSGTYNSARLAANFIKSSHLDVPVYLVDSLNASYSEVFILEEGIDLAKQGLPANEIATRLQEYVSRVQTRLFLQSLKYLHLGGRISIAKYLLGKFLKKMALVKVNAEGRNEPYGTVRDTRKGLFALINDATNNLKLFPRKACIVHTGNEPLATELEQLINEILPPLDLRKVLSRTSISAHTGPHGVAFIADFGAK